MDSNDFGAGFFLVALSGPAKDKEFTLTTGKNTIGRNEGHIVLDFDPKVSRQHCGLTLSTQETVLVDFGSTNGTWINGVKVQRENPTAVHPGDVFRIGDGEYRLVKRLDAAGQDPSALGSIYKTGSDFGGKLLGGTQAAADFGRKQVEAAAPHLKRAAAEAKVQALAGAEQLRLATKTGLKLGVVILIAVAMLLVCMILPVAVAWPMYVAISGIEEYSESSQGGDGGMLPGSETESYCQYAGFNYNSVFVPAKLKGDARVAALVTAIIAGPLIITGNSIQMTGQATDYDYGSASTGTFSFGLTSPGVTLWFVVALVLILLVADFVMGDQWAMQKLLTGIVATWFAYSITLGFIPQVAIRTIASGMADGGAYRLGFDPVRGAPLTIAVIGLVYWLISVAVRKFLLKQA